MRNVPTCMITTVTDSNLKKYKLKKCIRNNFKLYLKTCYFFSFDTSFSVKTLNCRIECKYTNAFTIFPYNKSFNKEKTLYSTNKAIKSLTIDKKTLTVYK